MSARATLALKAATRAAESSFPLEAYPEWLRRHVESVAHRLQVSADMPAVYALPVLAAAAGRKLTVRAWEKFTQPAVVWVVVAAASGENKSAVVSAMRGPLLEYQAERLAREQPGHDEARRNHALLRKQAEALATRAAGGRATTEETLRAAREADEAEPRPLFRLTFDSSTTEALVKELAAHEFLAHLQAEGDVFIDIVGRYDSGGLLKQYLDGFDGECIDLDRVGRGRVQAEQVRLVLGVMVQPDMLASIMAEGRFKGRGLLERALYAMPPSLAGRRNVSALEGEASAEAEYRRRMGILAERGHGEGEERVLSLEADAVSEFVAYRQRVEARLATDLVGIASWVNKAQGGQALRIAGLLAVARDVDARQVQSEDMRGAVRLMEEFFIPQALRTFGDLRGDATGWRERQVRPWIETQRGEVFTARDLQRARGDLFKSATDARSFLEESVQRGALEHVERPRTAKSGPSPEKGYRQVRRIRQDPERRGNPQQSVKIQESDSAENLSDLSNLSEGRSGHDD